MNGKSVIIAAWLKRKKRWLLVRAKTRRLATEATW
jgi:hypothetical protein